MKAKKRVNGNGKKAQGRGAASKEKLERRLLRQRSLARLHGELVMLQEWVEFKGLKVCGVVCQGPRYGGKGDRSRRSPSA